MDDIKIQLFEDQRIRMAWDEERSEWLLAIVDVIAVLTESTNPQTYWRVMKKRLKDEGNESVSNCNALKMTAADGKKRLTDVADTEQLLRLIQSIPSPKAEPFKMCLATVGRERIDEIIDPELTIDRALATYLKIWYDSFANEMLTVTQEETGGQDQEGSFSFSRGTLDGDEIIPIYPWATHIATFPLVKDGVSIFGYMVVSNTQGYECELILRSLGELHVQTNGAVVRR